MKRFAYILIPLRGHGAPDHVDRPFTPKEEPLADKTFEEDLFDSQLDASPDSIEETSITKLSYPDFETVKDEKGADIRVQTGLYFFERLVRSTDNECEATGITFEFYDRNRYTLPREERVVLKGSADKAKLFLAGDFKEMGIDLEFKKEFILQENVLIDLYGSRPGASPSFTLKANNLFFFEGIFKSTGAVIIEKEGMTIHGKGLVLDPESGLFSLDREIRIDGSRFDLSRLARSEPPPSGAGETEAESPPAPFTITATGPRGLELSRPPKTEGQIAVDPGLNHLALRGQVEVVREGLNYSCEELAIDFMDSPEGKSEIRHLIGTSGETRSVLDLEDYVVYCEVFDYRIENGKDIILITGNPVIDNISLPLFSTTSEPQTPALYTFRCRDRIRIASDPEADNPGQGYEVDFYGEVLVTNKQDEANPVLKADELSIQMASQESFPLPAKKTDDPAKTASLKIRNFQARGNVTGHIEDLDLAGNEFKYDFLETPDGFIHELNLTDPEASELSSANFTLRSPHIPITLRQGITDIYAREQFSCTSRLERLPRIKKFSLFPEEAAAAPQKEEESGGRMEIEGSGRSLRILIIEEEQGPHQTLKIEDSSYEIKMLRQEESILRIQGSRKFSLSIINSELQSMDLEGGGELFSPELGFSAVGDSMGLLREEDDSLKFRTEGSPTSNHIVFIQPEGKDSVTVHAKRIDITTGNEPQLIATEAVNALIPVALFRDEKSGLPSTNPRTENESGAVVQVNCTSLQLDRSADSESFSLLSRGEVTIQSEALSLLSTCEVFTYHSSKEVLALLGTDTKPATVKAFSPYDPDVFDSVVSKRVDLDLKDSVLNIYRGSTIALNPYNRSRGAFDEIMIRCENDVSLDGNLLEFDGPVHFEYQSFDQRDFRSLNCRKLGVYFIQSPLLARLSAWDYDAYETMVLNGQEPDSTGSDNMIKRIRAQDEILMEMEGYTIRECSLLSWDLLKDEILCDGLSKEIQMAVGNNTMIQCQRVRLRPVNEEVTIYK